jgi:hypothetical protein
MSLLLKRHAGYFICNHICLLFELLLFVFSYCLKLHLVDPLSKTDVLLLKENISDPHLFQQKSLLLHLHQRTIMGVGLN